MNKLKTIVASLVVAALSFGTAANSVELRAGLTGQSSAYYANAKEKLKDSGKVSSTEALAAFSYMSVFGEVAFDTAMGISVGIEYSPDGITVSKKGRLLINEAAGGPAGQSVTHSEGETSATLAPDSGTQVINAEVKDLTLIYVGIPVMDTGLNIKAGYHMSTLQTKETLATGSTYKDEDLEGISVGVYYDGSITDNLFYRVEGAYQSFDDIKLVGSEVGGTTASFNEITAELAGVAAKASIGFRF